MPRALLSVSDKRGLADFARGLSSLGYEIVSTGGTLQTLRDAGVPAVAVADVTGFPEILDGRVKTLHPRIHGGLLARREEAHLSELREHDITPIDLVAVNLYPFRETVARPGVGWAEALETIDIGGPSMLRAAAKNHPSVLVVVDPDDYPAVLEAVRAGPDEALRRSLARKAFAHSAAYDAAIVAWMERDEALPEHLNLALERAEVLRYGENPHQHGARYREVGSRGWWDSVVQHSGMALSYLNLFDADAAWRLAFELGAGRAAVIAKHANPCGAALAGDLTTAYAAAFEADPKSAFGGVVALPGTVDAELARAVVANPKADVLIARGFASEALELFARKRKNMRVLEAGPPGERGLELRRIDGGFLVQQPDPVRVERSEWKVVTRAQPTEQQWRDLELAYRVCAFTSSNAIVFAAGGSAVAVGAGQQSRVDAVEIAAKKAAGRARGGACASDAFFPFRDGVDAAADAGVAAVIQPGGSIRDEQVIEAADERGMAMVLTGERHFKH